MLEKICICPDHTTSELLTNTCHVSHFTKAGTFLFIVENPLYHQCILQSSLMMKGCYIMTALLDSSVLLM